MSRMQLNRGKFLRKWVEDFERRPDWNHWRTWVIRKRNPAVIGQLIGRAEAAANNLICELLMPQMVSSVLSDQADDDATEGSDTIRQCLREVADAQRRAARRAKDIKRGSKEA